MTASQAKAFQEFIVLATKFYLPIAISECQGAVNSALLFCREKMYIIPPRKIYGGKKAPHTSSP